MNTNVGDMPIEIFGDYVADTLGIEYSWEYLGIITADGYWKPYVSGNGKGQGFGIGYLYLAGNVVGGYDHALGFSAGTGRGFGNGKYEYAKNCGNGQNYRNHQ